MIKLSPQEEASSERIIIVMPPELIKKIEEYRRTRERIPNRSGAIRELIEAGLQAQLCT